jgi:hypothetical protein
MDLFIQRNFFPGATHLALVTDPVTGDVAICINTAAGIQYLECFWIDGREQKCRVPAKSSEQAGQTRTDGTVSASPEKIQALESRVSQLVQSLDEMKGFHYRFMMTCGFIFCVGIIATVGYAIYSQYRLRIEPPKLNQVVPVPIQVGDKTILLQVGIASWEIPDELNAMMVKAIQLKLQEEEKAAAKADMKAATNTPPTNTNAPAQK